MGFISTPLKKVLTEQSAVLKQQQRTAQATKTVMAMNGPGMTTIPRGTGVMPGREAALSNAPASDTQLNQPPSFKR